MTVPRLLFRGTCAISVWTSYQRALAEIKSAKNGSPGKKAIPPQAQIDRYMLQIRKCGPLYREGRIWVTGEMLEAFKYSRGYRILPSNRDFPGPNRIILRNRPMSEFDLPLDPSYLPEAVIKTLAPLCSTSSMTPGAILIIDGEYLAREGFIPKSYPFIRPVYCPWRAIRGILLVDQGMENDKSDAGITGFIFRDSGIKREIIWHLRQIPNLSRSFLGLIRKSA
jgi:hypothetical protein